MSTASRSRFYPVVVAGLLLAGCASTDIGSDSQARAAVDVPDHFLVRAPEGDIVQPSAGQGCRNPMVDPSDGTRLTLVRSRGDRGDYEAPAGRYGVGERELLRLECSTGKVVGVVER